MASLSRTSLVNNKNTTAPPTARAGADNTMSQTGRRFLSTFQVIRGSGVFETSKSNIEGLSVSGESLVYELVVCLEPEW